MDLRKLENREKLIDYIEGNENRAQKAESLKAEEIWFDRLDPYVRQYLKGQFNQSTVKEMPVISSINIGKRVAKQEASLYKKQPERSFSDISDEQKTVLENNYLSIPIDTMLCKANEQYKYRNQSHIMVIPQGGKLIGRVLSRHHIDSIPDPENPTKAIGYIISTFDKSFLVETNKKETATGYQGNNVGTYPDQVNQRIGDPDDYKSTLKRYVVWTRDYIENGEVVPGLNFIMDGKGFISTNEENILNPLREIDPSLLPIVNIADTMGTYEYWVRAGNTLTDMTIQFNASLSDLGNIVRMQGWAQAVVKGPADLMPTSMQIGPNHILMLNIDPNNPVETSFEYVSPSPDLQGSIGYIEMLLSNFLSSRGIDPKTISGKGESAKFTSGIERLLHLIEKFEASAEDRALFEAVEESVYLLVKAWHNLATKKTGLLNDKYVSSLIPESSTINVQYAGPEMIQTQQEKLDSIQREIELGLITKVDAIARWHNLTPEDAMEKAKEIDSELMSPIVNEDDNNGSET